MQSFTTDELDKFDEWLHKGFAKGARRGLLSAAMRMVSIIQTDVIPGESPPPIDIRVYASGWRAEPTEKGADVVNTVPYASIIEKGARAENIKIGRAMIDALTAWVLRKGFAGKPARSQSGKTQQAVDARNIAWAIAISMKKRGIFNRGGSQGLRIGEKARTIAVKFIPEEVAREIQRELSGK